MTTHAFVNVVIPFAAERLEAVNKELRGLARPTYGNAPRGPIEQALLDTGIVHFMSITAIDPRCPDECKSASDPPLEPDATAHLVFEMSVDGGRSAAVRVLATTLLAEVRGILTAAGLPLPGDLQQYLMDRTHILGARWGQTLGQVHGGSPGSSVKRICGEAILARQIKIEIQSWQNAAHPLNPRWRNGSARQRLDLVRNTLWQRRGFKWAFVPEAAPLLGPSPDEKWKKKPPYLNPMYWRAALSVFNTLLWPLYLVLLAVAAVVVYTVTHAHWPFIVDVGIAAALLTAFAFFLWLRRLEKNDPEEDRTPRADHVEELLGLENHCAQNLLASSSRLKAGWFRRLTLRLAFAVVGTGPFVSRPGFLGKNGVIHFARWMHLPGTDQLLFLSNYSGTWDSYVGDFIADAPTGVTAIWSNCVGFPRTTGLLGGGAANRDRLVRWARRQQYPAYFWFSAYPDVTAERIRINAAIRQGLATAETEADAVDWLSLFGSAPRPGTTLQVTEMPTLVFGGLSTLRFSACYAVTFRNDVAECKKWLALAAEKASYGEMQPGATSAVVVAVTRRGLERLGVPKRAIDTFPVAFQHGMWPDARARQLGDTGENAPQHWQWGYPSSHGEIDVLLLIYGKEQAQLQETEDLFLQKAAECGHSIRKIVQLAELAKKESAGRGVRTKEPFGFEDGISQPVLKGSPRWSLRAGPNDLVEAGEIVLGYPDNLGKIPPSPSIDAGHDPFHYLPDIGPDPFRQRPEFSTFEGTGQRDLGANGTFLVVRQLQQHVDRLEQWLKDDIPKQLGGSAGFLRYDRVIRGDASPPAPDSTNPPAPDHFSHVSLLATQPPLAEPGRSKQKAATDGYVDAKDLAGLSHGALKEFIGAKLIGRWTDGTSIVRYREQPGRSHKPPGQPDNDFLFGAEDASALCCPFGAHVRRANPRDTRFPGSAEELATVNRHRLLRVGRVYGELVGNTGKLDPQKPQGLLFMCLNADIDRQFEFVQKTWLLNPNLHGLDGEVDPLLGQGERNFTIPTATGPVRLRRIPTLVTVVGGGYFFLPGRGALRFLAMDARPGGAAAPHAPGSHCAAAAPVQTPAS